MTSKPDPSKTSSPGPGLVVIIGLYFYYLATVGRTLAWFADGHESLPQYPWVMGLELLFLVLFSLVTWLPVKRGPFIHLYILFQCCLVLTVLYLIPGADFTTGFLLLVSYHVALHTRSGARRAWLITLMIVSSVPLILLAGDPLRSLTLQLSSMAGIIVMAAYIAALQEEEEGRAQSQAILAELQEAHHSLEAYASQAEDLAALEERNRLARELHDSVSQTMFSIILNNRAAQILLKQDPARLRPLLETLQGLTQSALAEMRSLISQLRPK